MKRQTTMSHNKRNTNRKMFRTPVPQKSNVVMCVKESVLRKLRVSSTPTPRPLYATQHWTQRARGTQQPVCILFARVHWCCELYSVNSLLERGQRPLTYSLAKQECTSVRRTWSKTPDIFIGQTRLQERTHVCGMPEAINNRLIPLILTHLYESWCKNQTNATSPYFCLD